ncbi:hypothetical protein CVT91_11290 [Candidatus Atribacteria bacterium HGW-Atribacteria-1]|nr:MAG: hypothetical protein CVT91_11290 [Candidatus Atribacteria bacterium HGW-Atribacteria-1]
MENCKIRELIKAVSGKIIQGNQDCLISRISIDSRTLIPGDLFFAIIGLNFDGHDFIIEAFRKGAVGAIVCKGTNTLLRNEQIDKNKIIIEVKDTLSALQDWSKHYKDKFKTFNICVTGSNGKTTTKEIIAHILSREVITNIGEAHIGLLGSKDNIFKAKSELLQSLDKEGIAILNRDDPYFLKMLEIIKGKKVYTFGIENKSDIMARNIRMVSDKGMRFTLEVQSGKSREIYFPLLGRYNIYNALAASAAAFALGIELDLIESGLSSFKPLDLHMQLSNFYNGIKILNDSYNASPLSVKSALETLAEVAQSNRKIAILGDMLELGEKADFYHREIGKEVAKLLRR